MATSKMKGLYVRIQMWNGKYKQACSVTTVKSLIANCIIGVTEVSKTFYSKKTTCSQNALFWRVFKKLVF